jgi:ubiquinone/menaquinone biosynthesis C-methylase UbiE
MNPLRWQILSFETLFQRLSLHESSRVLEVRSGPDYFSVQAARGIPKGYLLLIDIQREVLAKAKHRIERPW